ncbi:DNA mismatch repair protein MutS, C-terminal domain protein, partial [Metarhizium hybridum]
MALDVCDDGTMGCAFFDSMDGSLQLAEDVHRSTVDVSEHFATLACPTLLLVSSRAPQEFLDHVQRSAFPYKSCVQILSSSEFSVEAAVDRLSSWRNDQLSTVRPSSRAPVDASVRRDLPNGGDGKRVDRCSISPEEGVANASTREHKNPVSLGCAGAVLTELRYKCISRSSPSSEPISHQPIPVKTFALENYVALGSETLQTLQIIQSKIHPNSQYWGGRMQSQDQKEGLSIYGLFQGHSHTPQGRAKLRRLISRPVSNVSIIEDRQQTISLFLLPRNADKIRHIIGALGKIRNAKTYLEHLQKGTGNITIPKFDQDSLVAIGELISHTVDFEQSEYRGRTTVRLGLDRNLDELRRHYDGMNSFLAEIVVSTIQTVPQWAVSYIRSCIFLPQLGFLIVTDVDQRTGKGKYRGNWPDEDHWELLFVADDSAYYKNDNMRHLDDQFGDVYCKIADREVEILHVLSQEVLKSSECLSVASDACGDVNVILALALTAEKYKWSVPKLTTRSGILEIKKGRHPLQELVVPSFVPNDCQLGGGGHNDDDSCQNQSRCMVLTGPNHSGKSIFLKQVGLIVYLAHIGSFVPAEMAVISVTDRILTRISTLESVCKEESAFAIDLKQLLNAIEQSTSKSLLIIDEFGKGTNSDDGAGLLASFLEHLSSLAVRAPRSLVATHIHDLFGCHQLLPTSGLQIAHMDVLKAQCGEFNCDYITYLFKLRDGYSSDLFGGYCATLNGVPNLVVERANVLSMLLSRNEDITIPCARLSPEEELKLHSAEIVARKFLEGFHTLVSEENCLLQDDRHMLQNILST